MHHTTPHSPFTRAQFVASGGSDHLLATADYHRVLRGVWVQRAHLDQETTLRGALLIHPRSAYASHLSAAAVHGLPVPDRPFVHVTVLRERDRRFRPEIKCHVTTRDRDLETVRGIRVTTVVDTFVACAGALSLVDQVVLGDALVRKFSLSANQLRTACDQSTEYYAGLARIAASYVRDGVDSPMETRLRLLIVLAGLPEPVVNLTVRNPDGSWRRRFDLCYPDLKLVIEYDGRQHADSIDQWQGDLERREELDDAGYRIIVVTARGIFKEPERTLGRIVRQLERRNAKPPTLREDWRDHFAA